MMTSARLCGINWEFKGPDYSDARVTLVDRLRLSCQRISEYRVSLSG